MGNDQSCDATGSKSVRFKLWDGSHRILDIVRLVPKLRRNLISLGMLDSNGITYRLENGVLKVMKGSMAMLRGVLKQGLYILQGEAIIGDVPATSAKQDQTLLWHKRLGNISMGGLQQLCKQGILDSTKITEMDLCEVCTLGKSHRLKFASSTYGSKEILEYVHSDLWGSPNLPISLSGAHYFISFVDDFSRKVWEYFLKQKSEAFDKFREWKLLVENQTGKRIKHLRTDNGLEYCNNVFSQFCTKFGIERHMTYRDTPQQNGIAERLNRTILNKVRCMLSESGLDKKFWAEATATTCYQINRSPSLSINFKTPEHMWTSRPPKIAHLRPFGCIGYVHINQRKLEPRAMKAIFLGYPKGVKWYRLWLINERKVIISRDVIFNENVFFKRNLQVLEHT